MLDSAAIAHGPASTHPLLLRVQVPLQRPTDRGLRADDELEAITRLDERLTAQLEERYDAWQIGRLTGHGRTIFVYHLAAGASGAIDPARGWEPYELQASLVEDPGWTFVRDKLTPSDRELQSHENSRLQHALRERGDVLEKSREVDHVALFDSREAAVAAAGELREAGFKVDDPCETEDCVTLEFHRDETVAGQRPDEFTTEILDLLERHAGQYDGWGCVITP